MRMDCITCRPMEHISEKMILLIDTKYPNEYRKVAKRDEKIKVPSIKRTVRRLFSEINFNNYQMPQRRNKKTEKLSDKFSNKIIMIKNFNQFLEMCKRLCYGFLNHYKLLELTATIDTFVTLLLSFHLNLDPSETGCVGRQLRLLYGHHHYCILNCAIYIVHLKFIVQEHVGISMLYLHDRSRRGLYSSFDLRSNKNNN